MQKLTARPVKYILPAKTPFEFGTICNKCPNNCLNQKYTRTDSRGTILVIIGHPIPLEKRFIATEYYRNLIAEAYKSSPSMLKESLILTYAVKCFSTDKDALAHNIEALNVCRQHLYNEINTINPSFIIATGFSSIQSLFPDIQEYENTNIQTQSYKVFNSSIDKYFKYPMVFQNIPVIATADLKTPYPIQGLDKDLIAYYRLQVINNIKYILSGMYRIPAYKNAIYAIRDNALLIDETRDINLVKDYFSSLEYKDLYVAIDIETSTGLLRPYNGTAKISSIAFYGKNTGALVVYLQYASESYTQTILKILKNFFMTSKVKQIYHNMLFDLEHLVYLFGQDILLRAYNDLTLFNDSLIAQYCLDQKPNRKSLDFLSRIFLGFFYKDDEEVDRNSLQNASKINLMRYNAMDVIITYYVFMQEAILLQKRNNVEMYQQICANTIGCVIMQNNGFYVDENFLQETESIFVKKSLEHLKAIREFPEIKHIELETKDMFNPKSPIHMTMLLKAVLKNSDPVLTATGKFNISEETLYKYKHEHPIISCIIDYVTGKSLQSKTTKPLLENKQDQYGNLLIWDDGKVHSSYSTVKTVTARLNSEFPNMQNLPKRNGLEWLRNIFKCQNGFVLVSIDLAQIDWRLAALSSQDYFLIKALWNNQDIHMVQAEALVDIYPKILNIYASKLKLTQNYDKSVVLKSIRSQIKSGVVFAWIYRASQKTMATTMGIPDIDPIRVLVRKLEQDYPAIPVWHDNLRKFYNTYNCVRSVTGSILSGNFTYTQLCNHPIQHATAYVISEAKKQIIEKLTGKGVSVINQIHDDIVMYMPKENYELLIDEAVSIMCNLYKTPKFSWLKSIPIGCEVSVSEKGWGDLKTYKKASSIDLGHTPLEGFIDSDIIPKQFNYYSPF